MLLDQDMKDKIVEIVEKYSKHYVRMIKNREELMTWVVTHSKVSSDDIGLLIYSALNDVSNVCPYGKEKKFGGLSVGLRNCGSSKVCQCTREQVSKSVIQTKKTITEEQQKKINIKRAKTNLEKYGVENIGQTNLAKLKHREFYLTHENKKNTIESKSAKQIGYEKFKGYIDKQYNFKLLTTLEEYRGIRQKDAYEYLFQCNICKDIVSYRFYHKRGITCDKCNPKKPLYTSHEEQSIFDYITQDLKVNGVQSDKKLINPYELDMVFHEYKIAIEYCGLYWHSELSSGKHRNYHKTKMELVNELGYRLITIFSDEWLNKKEIVKKRLQHIFNKSTSKQYARNLKVVEITNTDAKSFLNQYHIQGYTIAPIKLGLVDNYGKLFALMTFSKGRASLNSSDEYELVRYVTNGTVVGGAGKLLKYFTKLYNPKKIATYADLRWSQGNLYKVLGFNRVGDAKVGYWYVENYNKRLHRYNFTKHKLVRMGANSFLTEWKIMQNLNYDRIWDCGHQKFELIL